MVEKKEMNEKILRKYNIINKSCINCEEIAELLDVTLHQAKKVVAEIRAKHKDSPYLRKGYIPFGLAEETLVNYGLNIEKIERNYERELKK